MSGDVLVSVENLSKRFCRSLKRSLWYGLQDLGSELLTRRHGGGRGLPMSSDDVSLRSDEFWALKDVCLEMRRGECLGLIGRNGAGKTTLLRLLNGLIKPDTGKIEIKGRIGPLIALGAGFNPVLTGRENVFINAGILGLSKKQTESKLEEIVDFAEISEFIDSPVQSYSSGMQVRLGFAVATALQPDVLLIDEVLAVGDMAFRAKSYKKLGEIMKDTAVIIVSHNEAQIQRLCKNSVYLAGGTIRSAGSTSQVFDVYNTANSSSFLDSSRKQEFVSSQPVTSYTFHPDVLSVQTGQKFMAELVIESSYAVDLSSVSLHFSKAGEFVCYAVLRSDHCAMKLEKGTNRFNLGLESLPLASGSYSLMVVVYADRDRDLLLQAFEVCSLTVVGLPPTSCTVSLPLILEDSQL